MHSQTDKLFMRRAIQLAKLGQGKVSPNPLVGCVIVHDQIIIGEGYHQEYGAAHAEVNALASVVDKTLLLESTLYVTLEPCAHHGKTPPCVDLILKHNIKRVVVGCLDPFEKVNGKGLKKLKAAGVKLTLGVLKDECYQINQRFFVYHTQKRPYVIAKWAQSAEGYIAKDTNGGLAPVALSNVFSQSLSHKYRTQEDAIMVGTQTAITDNPKLTTRHWQGKHPLRVTLDKSCKIPPTHHLLSDKHPTLVFTQSKHPSLRKNKEFLTIDFSNNIIPQILRKLYEKNIHSLIVEGGKALLESFHKGGVIDEIRVFKSNKAIGKGLEKPSIPFFEEPEVFALGKDQLFVSKKP